MIDRVYTRNKPLLTIKNLNLEFDGNKILRDINVQILDINRDRHSQGQIVSLLGPSGIGKTQLFRCIAGLNKPTSGGILVTEDQHPVHSGDVGFVFQHYPLLQHRTVMSNLVIASEANNKTKEECETLLESFGLLDKANHYPSQLSGGQRQRVSIIQQFLCSDHFVLMDEPFSGLDVVSKEKIMHQIVKVAGMHDHNTFVLTTHDIEAAVEISDTIWILGRDRDEKGQIIPGARIVKEICLIDEGITWTKNVRDHPKFHEICEKIHKLFASL